jgi:hypothetical protein
MRGSFFAIWDLLVKQIYKSLLDFYVRDAKGLALLRKDSDLKEDYDAKSGSEADPGAARPRRNY